MRRLTAINEEIHTLAALADNDSKVKIAELRLLRKQHSFDLQQQLFAQYHFLNKKGESKSLVELFSNAGYRQAPAGAGECAAFTPDRGTVVMALDGCVK